MTEFSYDEKSLIKDGKRWFPMMGEFHYSRYPKKYWTESLYKMKAGGIDIVSSYVIWIHHEEVEGKFDFSGQRNLRRFVEKIKESGMYMILRVGPWAHAEARHGGFPDWLMEKGYDLRSDDPGYLAAVRRFFEEIYGQVEGLLLKDGGPIIGMQLENEYGHAGGYGGEKGEQHMHTLYHMVREIGFDVPLYTATGWGGAVTAGLLPVMGGYCDAPWDRSVEELPPSGNYVLTSERNDHNIGNDYGKKDSVTFDPLKVPYLTAELGGGLQVTHHRRPVATAKDTGAMSVTKLGSGCNLLGYYMYHGGINPEGKISTLEESFATGGYNDLPVKNYDFNAPIGAYGQCREAYGEIRKLALFAHDFGNELCGMDPHFPEDNPKDPNDLKHLRYSYRTDGKSGYVFVNNYVRRHEMAEHQGVELSVMCGEEKVTFPKIDIKNGDYFFWPVNMELEPGALLKQGCATPLCKLNNAKTTYVFYGDREMNPVVEGEQKHSEFLQISEEDAQNATKITLDQDYLFVSKHTVVPMKDGVHLFGRTPLVQFVTYPALTKTPKGFERIDTEHFTVYQREARGEELEDVFLEISYEGDGYDFLIDGNLKDDHFYTGQVAEIGMKRYGLDAKFEIEVKPFHEGDKVFLEKFPKMKDGVAREVNSIQIEKEWEAILEM